MQKDEEIVRLFRGRQRCIRLDVKAWRKKMKRWEKLKTAILEILEQSGVPEAEIKEWFHTPNPKLSGRAPKACFNPKSVAKLYPVVIKQFDKSVRQK